MRMVCSCTGSVKDRIRWKNCQIERFPEWSNQEPGLCYMEARLRQSVGFGSSGTWQWDWDEPSMAWSFRKMAERVRHSWALWRCGRLLVETAEKPSNGWETFSTFEYHCFTCILSAERTRCRCLLVAQVIRKIVDKSAGGFVVFARERKESARSNIHHKKLFRPKWPLEVSNGHRSFIFDLTMFRNIQWSSEIQQTWSNSKSSC
jgi:hypothetical protein